MEKLIEPMELGDAELAAVAGGITLSFGNFGGPKIVTVIAGACSTASFVTDEDITIATALEPCSTASISQSQ